MNELRTIRDEELGAALRQLKVPEHAPGFDERLAQRIVRQMPAAGRVPRPRPSRRLALLAAALAVAAVSVVVGIPRLAGNSIETASAAEVNASVRAALGSVATMQGRVVSIATDPLTGKRETRAWRFAATAEGDFRLDELDGPGRLAYDAAAGVERQLNTSASIGTGLFAVERSGLALGGPDPGPADWILQRELGSVVRALLAAPDARVTDVRYDGREAWRVDLDVRPNAISADADRLAITVDQATGIPVRVVQTLRGRFTRELRIEALSLLGALPADAFDLDFPPGVEVTRTDHGFRRLTLAQVREAAGYAPLVPDWMPAGFELTEVAFAPRAEPTGTEAANPRSARVVSLSYRRGFDEFVVTTRRSRPTGAVSAWEDPLASGEGFVDEPMTVVLRHGSLSGVAADLLVSPRGVPHIWTVADELVVTVSGDLTHSDLVRVAESLRAAQ